jgi:hypothetical protein
MTTYATLAAEATARYHLDPLRVDRAINIIENHTVMMARVDEDGKQITPTHAAYAVKSPAKKSNQPDAVWYIVRPADKSCQCYDSHAGNICKHRIAVYLYTELPRRQFAEIAQTQTCAVLDTRN